MFFKLRLQPLQTGSGTVIAEFLIGGAMIISSRLSGGLMYPWHIYKEEVFNRCYNKRYMRWVV
jgi:hypothetical protein